MSLPIHHLTLSVSNAERSAAWYQALLGDAVVTEREGPDYRRIRMLWPNGLMIGVSQFNERTDESAFSPRRVGLDHVGLACATPGEVRGWFDRLEQLGFVHGPLEDAPYAWAVTARDPDNIPIEFFCAK